MDGTWCIAPAIQRERSRYRYDFIRPFDLYLNFMGIELEQDLILLTLFRSRGSPQSIVALGANPLPASHALVVVKQRQPILLYFRYQPFGLPR